jgi:hypothetical protein
MAEYNNVVDKEEDDKLIASKDAGTLRDLGEP